MSRSKAWDKVNREKIRNAIFALLGEECVRCHISDKRVLQVDHIHRAKEPRNSYLRSGLGLWYQIINGNKPLSDFQILCCNCNFIKKLENSEHYPVHKTESKECYHTKEY